MWCVNEVIHIINQSTENVHFILFSKMNCLNTWNQKLASEVIKKKKEKDKLSSFGSH